MRTRFTIPALSFACGLLAINTACGGPSLAGDWTGEMDCSDEDGWMEIDIDMPLVDAGDGEFTGSFEGDGEAVFSGESYPVRIEADIELEFTTDSAEEQNITTLWNNCEVWVADEYADDDCGIGSDWDWDGADTLSTEDDECTMTLKR